MQPQASLSLRGLLACRAGMTTQSMAAQPGASWQCSLRLLLTRKAHEPLAPTDQSSHAAVALAQDGDAPTERDGAQSSAAWCLSAVLLFMSLLLLRQAFEPLSRQSEAPGTAVNAGGQNRHMATVLGAPASPLHFDNMTTTVLLLPLGSAAGPGLTDEQVMREISRFYRAGAIEACVCRVSPADACRPSGPACACCVTM